MSAPFLSTTHAHTSVRYLWHPGFVQQKRFWTGSEGHSGVRTRMVSSQPERKLPSIPDTSMAFIIIRVSRNGTCTGAATGFVKFCWQCLHNCLQCRQKKFLNT